MLLNFGVHYFQLTSISAGMTVINWTAVTCYLFSKKKNKVQDKYSMIVGFVIIQVIIFWDDPQFSFQTVIFKLKISLPKYLLNVPVFKI